MDILTEESHADMISWCSHGKGFLIHKKKHFAAEILPKYFKASLFTSFTRKLNRWGFSRIPRGHETGAYYHKLFRRDKPELCLQMTSNSGNKYTTTPSLQNQLLPAVPGMMGGPGMPHGMPGMFPYMAPPMAMSNLAPQQQQAMWHQQMQSMMQIQQMQMMHMHQQQQMQQGGPSGPSPAFGAGFPQSGNSDNAILPKSGEPAEIVPRDEFTAVQDSPAAEVHQLETV
jgi:hypothetical protein